MIHHLRASAAMLSAIHEDLSRPHPHAHERVGFAFANAAKMAGDTIGLYLSNYRPVEDLQYIFEPNVGALVDGDALREAMQFAYSKQLSTFHVHRHEHRGRPWFSNYDMDESGKFIPDFFHVAPRGPHGALLLSHDSATAIIWTRKDARPQLIREIVLFGPTLTALRAE